MFFCSTVLLMAFCVASAQGECVQRGTAVVCRGFPRPSEVAHSPSYSSESAFGTLLLKLRISESTCQLLHLMKIIPKDVKEWYVLVDCLK